MDAASAGTAAPPVLEFRPVAVETGSPDEGGRLVFMDGRLVAVFVRLSGLHVPESRGKWSLEAGFGPCPCARDVPDVFATPGEAEAWVRGQIAGDGRHGAPRGAIPSQAAAPACR